MKKPFQGGETISGENSFNLTHQEIERLSTGFLLVPDLVPAFNMGDFVNLMRNHD